MVVCNYDPSIPIIIDAENLTICNRVEIPNASEVEDYQSLLNRLAIRDHEIQYLKDKSKQKEYELQQKLNEYETNMKEREQMLIHYEETIYKILPTNNKAFIVSDFSGLKKEASDRIENLTKKDIIEQKKLLVTIAMRQSRSNMLYLLKRNNEAKSLPVN